MFRQCAEMILRFHKSATTALLKVTHEKYMDISLKSKLQMKYLQHMQSFHSVRLSQKAHILHGRALCIHFVIILCYLWTSKQEILNKGGSLVIQRDLDRMIELKEETKMKMANENVGLGLGSGRRSSDQVQNGSSSSELRR
ncbi:hypothetical protein MTR67_033501 [Solanum verrucosum]|uniref:Uncharacterized protein n=1 Tax=Solanum verrucosum TaxID=315347 RepID=A0AAF0U6I2_SOLVR|nr:hypothetical protein MTR67_033501 [Solanum verrucosum]